MSFSHPLLPKIQGKEHLMMYVTHLKASKFHFRQTLTLEDTHIYSIMWRSRTFKFLPPPPRKSKKCQMLKWFSLLFCLALYLLQYDWPCCFFPSFFFKACVYLAWIKKASSKKKSDWFENVSGSSCAVFQSEMNMICVWLHMPSSENIISLRRVSPRLISINTCKSL